MDDIIQTQHGQSLRFNVTFWQDSNRTLPLDLESSNLSIREASREILKICSVSHSSDETGVILVSIPENIMEKLPVDEISWLKIEVQFAESNRISPKIKIHINE